MTFPSSGCCCHVQSPHATPPGHVSAYWNASSGGRGFRSRSGSRIEARKRTTQKVNKKLDWNLRQTTLTWSPSSPKLMRSFILQFCTVFGGILCSNGSESFVVYNPRFSSSSPVAICQSVTFRAMIVMPRQILGIARSDANLIAPKYPIDHHRIRWFVLLFAYIS